MSLLDSISNELSVQENNNTVTDNLVHFGKHKTFKDCTIHLLLKRVVCDCLKYHPAYNEEEISNFISDMPSFKQRTYVANKAHCSDGYIVLSNNHIALCTEHAYNYYNPISLLFIRDLLWKERKRMLKWLFAITFFVSLVVYIYTTLQVKNELRF